MTKKILKKSTFFTLFYVYVVFFAYLRGMFHHFLNKYWSISTLLILLSMAGLWSCASTGSPGGGLYDETPPVMVRSTPDQGATNVNRKKIVMRFDENVKLDNANEKMTISPPQERTATILSNGKTVTIELQDSLKSNTTYTIDLGDAVQDNNEGNAMENLTLTFSTGNHIDTMKVIGTLLNAEDLEPITGAFVGIYAVDENGVFPPMAAQGDSLQLAIDSIVALYPDSLFSLRPMERAGKTDSQGRFTISGVSPGQYRMYALKDGNTNYKYDLFSEDIAFLDSLIIPSVGSHWAEDTIWNLFDSTKVDTIHVHEVTDYYPNNLCLRMFNEGFVNRYLDESAWKDSVTVTMRFAAQQDSLPLITLIGEEERGAADVDKDAWMICEPNATHDTLTYWLRDSLVYHRDTIWLAVTYPYTVDGVDKMVTDTIHLENPVLNKQATGGTKKFSLGDDKKDKKKKKKKKEITNPEDSIPKTVFMTISLKEKSIDVGSRPHLETSAPLDTLDLSHIRMEQKKDSIWKPFSFELVQDSLCLRRYTIVGKPHFSPGMSYRLIADSASMHDIYGHPVDSTALSFNEKKPEDYAHLLFNIQGIEGPAFVQLLDEKDKPKAQAPVKDGQAKFPNINAGKYYARLVEDANNNGKFDVGSLKEHRQAEQVYYYSTLLELRENWQFSQTWNVRALPTEQQKPEALIQNKPKQKQQKKSRNEEYLREHPSMKRKMKK